MGKSEAADSKSKKNEEVSQVTIISRATWGALPPKSEVLLDLPAKDIIYTDTNTKTCSTKQECSKLVKELQKYHLELRDLTDIEYNFLVGGDGNVYEGRGWHTASKDSSGENDKKSIEIAFIGSFKEDDIPSEMKETASNLIEFGIKNELISLDEYVKDNNEDSDDDDKKKT